MPGIFIAAFVVFVVFVVALFAVLIIFKGFRPKNANEMDWDVTPHHDSNSSL
jgi:hypothetical protein